MIPHTYIVPHGVTMSPLPPHTRDVGGTTPGAEPTVPRTHRGRAQAPEPISMALDDHDTQQTMANSKAIKHMLKMLIVVPTQNLSLHPGSPHLPSMPRSSPLHVDTRLAPPRVKCPFLLVSKLENPSCPHLVYS
jgi:hypothetical protein